MPFEKLQDYLMDNLKIYINEETTKLSYLALADNAAIFAATKRGRSPLGKTVSAPVESTPLNFELERDGTFYRVTIEERKGLDKVEKQKITVSNVIDKTDSDYLLMAKTDLSPQSY